MFERLRLFARAGVDEEDVVRDVVVVVVRVVVVVVRVVVVVAGVGRVVVRGVAGAACATVRTGAMGAIGVTCLSPFAAYALACARSYELLSVLKRSGIPP